MSSGFIGYVLGVLSSTIFWTMFYVILFPKFWNRRAEQKGRGGDATAKL